jgi:DNA polymerase III epsilon subunit-like protein
MEFSYYALDTETTGFDPIVNDIIELSIYRKSDDSQRTWFLKPSNVDGIDLGALKVNGHKLEDLKWETKYGRETYMPADKAIIEIENWIMEDSVTSEERVLVGQQISFDRNFCYYLWQKCGSSGTFPFGRKMIDTIQIELVMSLTGMSDAETFSLSSLIKRYGIKNEKAHSASADTKATNLLFEAQLERIRSKLK